MTNKWNISLKDYKTEFMVVYVYTRA
jgi:hypothetical protein